MSGTLPLKAINSARMIRKILIGLLVLLVVIQFFRPARNNGAAAATTDITHAVHTPDTVLHILQHSCYDCHSNHTEYPWYVNINPVGWWLRHHIDEGKRELNFSEASTYSKKKLDHKLEEIVEQVEKKEMPLSSYTFIHTEAKLNDGQIALIKAWVDSARREVA